MNVQGQKVLGEAVQTFKEKRLKRVGAQEGLQDSGFPLGLAEEKFRKAKRLRRFVLSEAGTSRAEEGWVVKLGVGGGHRQGRSGVRKG